MLALNVNDSGILFIYPEDSKKKLREDHFYVCYGFTDNAKDLAVGERCKGLVASAFKTCECDDNHSADYKSAFTIKNRGFQEQSEGYYIRMSRVADAFFVSSKHALGNMTSQTAKDVLNSVAIAVATVAAIWIYRYFAQDANKSIKFWNENLGKVVVPVKPLRWDPVAKDWMREMLTEERLYVITQHLKIQAFFMNCCAVGFGLFGAANFHLSISESEIVSNYRDRYTSYFNEHSPKRFYKLVSIDTE